MITKGLKKGDELKKTKHDDIIGERRLKTSENRNEKKGKKLFMSLFAMGKSKNQKTESLDNLVKMKTKQLREISKWVSVDTLWTSECYVHINLRCLFGEQFAWCFVWPANYFVAYWMRQQKRQPQTDLKTNRFELVSNYITNGEAFLRKLMPTLFGAFNDLSRLILIYMPKDLSRN